MLNILFRILVWLQ